MYMDEPTFAQRFEADAQATSAGIPGTKLQDFVDRYDGNGIVIKTNQHTPDPTTQHREVERSQDKWTKDAVKRMKQKKK